MPTHRGSLIFSRLRPSEIQGLQWIDVDSDWLHIRRGVVRNIVDKTKTEESIARYFLSSSLWKGLFELWKHSPRRLSSKWTFPNANNKPVDLKSLVFRIIRPTLDPKGIEWKGIYAGRAIRLYWMMRQGWNYQQWSKFGSHAGQPEHRYGVQSNIE
jgi:integrase